MKKISILISLAGVICISGLLADEEHLDVPRATETSVSDTYTSLTLDDIYETTVSYLSYLKDNKEPDIEEVRKYSAISPYISVPRQKQLIAYLRDMHSWLAGRILTKEGDFGMRMSVSRVSGDMASAILYLFKEDNITDIGILPVTYILKDNKWCVTPFISSFSNSSNLPDQLKEDTAEELEKWVLQKPNELELEAVKKSEESLSQRLATIRDEKKTYDAEPLDLIKIWIAALKAGDADTVAAISEIAESSGNTSRIRWEEAKQYVKKADSALLLTNMLQAESSVIVPFSGEESRRIYLGVLDLNSYFPSDDAVFLFPVSIGKGYGGKGYRLILPKTFGARAQGLFKEVNSSESAEDLNKNIITILNHYLETHPRKEFRTPEIFTEEYIKVFSSKNISAESLLSMMDKSYLETVDAFDKVRSTWQDTNSTREYVKRMSNEHRGWKEEAVFASKLHPIDDDNVLFLMTWYSPLTLPQSYGVHSVAISKKEGKWYWNLSPKNKPDLDGITRDFYNEIKEKALQLRKEHLIYIDKKELPVIPEKELTKEQISLPDDSLNAYIQEILKKENSMEQFFFRQKGTILVNDEETPITLSTQWNKWERTSPQSLKKVKWHDSPDEDEYTGELFASQNGDWALIVLKLKGQEETQFLAQPLVKHKGNWHKISLNNLYSVKGDNGEEARSMPKKNSNPLYDNLDRRIFLPMLKQIIMQ